MELFDHLRKISFLFFVIIGLTHFLSGLFYSNGYLIPESGLINRVLFIPFVVALMTYGFSNLKYHLLKTGNISKGIDYALIGVGLFVFLSLLALELLFPDSGCPLSPSCL